MGTPSPYNPASAGAIEWKGLGEGRGRGSIGSPPPVTGWWPSLSIVPSPPSSRKARTRRFSGVFVGPPPRRTNSEPVMQGFGNHTYSRYRRKSIPPGRSCCQPDCTSTCETACCFVENLAAPAEAQCFEYTGTSAQVAACQASCTNGTAPPASGSGDEPLTPTRPNPHFVQHFRGERGASAPPWARLYSCSAARAFALRDSSVLDTPRTRGGWRSERMQRMQGPDNDAHRRGARVGLRTRIQSRAAVEPFPAPKR